MRLGSTAWLSWLLVSEDRFVTEGRNGMKSVVDEGQGQHSRPAGFTDSLLRQLDVSHEREQ